jgi:hypothetical protein
MYEFNSTLFNFCYLRSREGSSYSSSSFYNRISPASLKEIEENPTKGLVLENLREHSDTTFFSGLNYRFYANEISSNPQGDFIDNIHKNWHENHSLLESHHGHVLLTLLYWV